MSVVGAGLVIGMGFLTWSTANANCTEVGAGNGTAALAFRDAFDAAGGRTVLGCATEDVVKWGPGLAQSFEGGELGPGRILSGDRFGQAFVLAGQLWESYRWIAEGAASEIVGFPITPPLKCDGSYTMGFQGGADGPGALVQSDAGDEYIWLGSSVWILYVDAGGPGGPLGRPVEASRDNTGSMATFANGSISAAYGEAPTALFDGPAQNPLDLAQCAVVPLREAAGI